MRLPKIAAAATLASALVLLAACDGDPPHPSEATGTANPISAPASEVPEPTSTPTVDPTPDGDGFDETVPPESPSGLAGPASKEAAGEVAAYFMMLNPYIFSTGDLTAFKAMSGENCNYCDGIIDAAAEYKAAGKRTVGGQVLISDVQVFDYKPGEFDVALRITQEPIRAVDESGRTLEEAGRATATAEIHMVWSNKGWHVNAVDLSTLGTS